jgi:hypothetical protein
LENVGENPELYLSAEQAMEEAKIEHYHTVVKGLLDYFFNNACAAKTNLSIA